MRPGTPWIHCSIKNVSFTFMKNKHQKMYALFESLIYRPYECMCGDNMLNHSA